MKGKSFFSRLFGGGAPTREEAVQVKTPNPHESLLATTIMFLSTILQDSKYVPKQCTDASDQLMELTRLGLGNTANASRLRRLAERSEAYDKAVDVIRFMCEAWEAYGRNTIVLRLDHFCQVLQRHNLLCGNLSHFVGELPLEALQDYQKAYRKLSGKFCSAQLTDLGNLPFIDRAIFYEPFYIAAPIECFEVAPKGELDPFIFSCSENGYILIHAKWGAEAEDVTIERYEQLRDAIIGKGGEV